MYDVDMGQARVLLVDVSLYLDGVSTMKAIVARLDCCLIVISEAM